MGTTTPVDVARVLLEAGAVVLRPQQPFQFASGLWSPIYCDNRLLLGQVAARSLVVEALAALIQKEIVAVEVIAGTATAGIPWAAWVAAELQLPMIYVRSGAKAYGRSQQVEGGLHNRQKVVLIEDLVSTGGSALQAVEALRELDASVADCCAIFSYGMTESQTRFGAAGMRLLPLTDLPTLLDVATKEEYILPQQRAAVERWASDPHTWSEQHAPPVEG